MMKLSEIVSGLELKTFAPAPNDIDVSGGYTSDLLSDVIANSARDNVWVTMQTHSNIVAVAALKDLAAIIIVGDHTPANDMLELAKNKGICVLGTAVPAFIITGKLYELGIRGGQV
jgi:hypothetical protein